MQTPLKNITNDHNHHPACRPGTQFVYQEELDPMQWFVLTQSSQKYSHTKRRVITDQELTNKGLLNDSNWETKVN